MMEEEEGNGQATPPLEPRRHELLAAAVGEDNMPAAAVSTHMNFEGSREFFSNHHPPLQMVAQDYQQGSVPQRRPSTCSRPKVLWAFHW